MRPSRSLFRLTAFAAMLPVVVHSGLALAGQDPAPFSRQEVRGRRFLGSLLRNTAQYGAGLGMAALTLGVSKKLGVPVEAVPSVVGTASYAGNRAMGYLVNPRHLWKVRGQEDLTHRLNELPLTAPNVSGRAVGKLGQRLVDLQKQIDALHVNPNWKGKIAGHAAGLTGAFITGSGSSPLSIAGATKNVVGQLLAVLGRDVAGFIADPMPALVKAEFETAIADYDADLAKAKAAHAIRATR